MKTEQERKDGRIYLTTEDGFMVVIDEDTLSKCTACNERFPLQLRQTHDRVVRNQPQCPNCRGGADKHQGAIND